MNKYFAVLSGMLCFLFLSANGQPLLPDANNLPVVAKGASLQLVARQFAFTEGPAVNREGDIYFTDQPNDKIWKYDVNGKLSLYMDKTGRSNGMYFDAAGNLIACADEHNELWSIGPDKKITVLLDNVQGKKLNGPNDLWIDHKGGIYFTDPYYQRDYWQRTKPALDGQYVYYLPKGKTVPVIADTQFKQPNGIVGTPDGKYLYVSDLSDGKTYKYSIAADGSLQNRQLFVLQGSDGMTLDNQGNVYLSGNGITVYTPAGVKLGTIAVPEKWTGNICFGGKKKNILFITASAAVYTLQMRVKGVE